MKKWIVMLLVVAMLVSFAACGNQQEETQNQTETQPVSQEATEMPTEESVPEEPATLPEFLDSQTGGIKYTGCEKGEPGLTDYEVKDFVVVHLEFTNKQPLPKKVSEMYNVQFFQNNVEIEQVASFWSTGGEQYDACCNYFKEVMNGATISYGRGILTTDSSPVTIFMEDKQTGEMASITIELPQ